MSVYLTATALTIALAWIWERRRRWWLAVLAAVPLTVVAVVRWNVGTDFHLTYLPEYRAVEVERGEIRSPDQVREFRKFAKRRHFGDTPKAVCDHFTRVMKATEPLHRVLMRSAPAIGMGFRAVVAFYAVLTLACVFVAVFRFSRWPTLAAFLFVAGGNYFLCLNIMRQYLAIGVGLLSLVFVLERKPLRFLACIAVATCCHYSAIVLLPVYALGHFTLTPKRSALLVLVAFGLALVSPPLLREGLPLVGLSRYARYFSSHLAADGFEYLFFAINLCFLAMGAWYWKRASVQTRWFSLWYGMTALGTAALAMSGMVPLMKRINYYYAAPQFLLLPEMLLAEENPRRRRILTVLVIVAFVAETVVSVCMLNKNGVLPYRTGF